MKHGYFEKHSTEFNTEARFLDAVPCGGYRSGNTCSLWPTLSVQLSYSSHMRWTRWSIWKLCKQWRTNWRAELTSAKLTWWWLPALMFPRDIDRRRVTRRRTAGLCQIWELRHFARWQSNISKISYLQMMDF